ncbi:MAG TPA: zf-HC2 domain-containing protein [Planctomycetota bacterium]|nr:zf-HC2 domain-containing protein [Planctomycetota bacterium]
MEKQDFMGCGEIRELLPLYVGGEASEEDRGAVEEHVRFCGACARELDQYREARTHLAVLREVDVPPGLWRSMWAGIRGELFPRSVPAAGASWMETGLRCAAALFLGVAIGLGAHLVGGDRPQEIPAAPEGVREPVSASVPGSGPARVLSSEPWPARRAPRFEMVLPEANPDEDAYLPRVESLLSGDEREF